MENKIAIVICYDIGIDVKQLEELLKSEYVISRPDINDMPDILIENYTKHHKRGKFWESEMKRNLKYG